MLCLNLYGRCFTPELFSQSDSASPGSIQAAIMRKEYSPTFPMLSIVRHSFIQLSELGRRGVNKNARNLKR